LPDSVVAMLCDANGADPFFEGVDRAQEKFNEKAH
jgi:hypothetical protein